MTDQSAEVYRTFDEFCRISGIPFLCADTHGCFARIFNDFGDSFEVVDQDGIKYLPLVIESISLDEVGLVTLMPGSKHEYQDGDSVFIEIVDDAKEGLFQSLNATVH